MQIVPNWKAGFFIEVGWACEVCKPTKALRYPFQSAHLRALGRTIVTDKSGQK
jgi:hypothetical protein